MHRIDTFDDSTAVHSALQHAMGYISELYTAPLSDIDLKQFQGTVVPCQRLWDGNGKEIIAAIRYRPFGKSTIL